MATVDILHPFASLEWQECHQLSVGMKNATAVWHGDKLYVGRYTSGSRRDDTRLYIYIPNTDTWDTPIDTPVYRFALTIYHSQLVLIGGREYVADENVSGPPTNKLWILGGDGQWQETLPPMPTKRHCVCAASHKDYLLVAGGATLEMTLNIVEVFNDNHWLIAQPLPMRCYDLTSAILDGHWYLMGGEEEISVAVHYASIDSLLASCQPSETSQPSSVWKRLANAPNPYSSTAVFGGRLIAVGGALSLATSTVHGYSFYTNSWIHIGDMPIAASRTCSVLLPTGELMVVGGYDGICTIRNVLKATIKVTSYDPESHFTSSALSRLEGVGIPVITSLLANIYLFQQALSMIVPHLSTFDDRMSFLNAWLSPGGHNRLPTTWKNLLLIIRLLNQNELAQRMETYLSGATDLEVHHSILELSGVESKAEEDADKRLHLRDEVIYKLKQEISLLKEESNSAVFIFKEKIALLTAENEQLRSELLAKKETGLVTDDEKPLIPQIKTEPKEEATTITISQPEISTTWNLRGVEVCGEMTVVVYSSHYQQIVWPGYGLSLHVSKGCLPAGMEQCTINIKASLAGQYEFPENSHLVSAIFWLRCEGVHKFTRPIRVEIQHCAKLQNVSNLKLSFVRAVCSQKQLPYTFKQLPGGNFTSHSSYGVIELNSFSGVGVTQEGSEDREYCSQLFYLGPPILCQIHFVVTWNIEAHLTVVKEEYKDGKALLGPRQLVEFESEAISLDIPLEGLSIKGWKITPLMRPVVTKKQVDNFREGKLTPCCQLLAEISGRKNRIPTLKHQINLKGAKYPNDVFVINLPAGDANLLERSQTFGDLAATTAATGPPPTKKSRIYSDESALLTVADSNSSQMLSTANHASLADPASSDGLDTKLVKPELKDLIKELFAKASDKWENIGILLGIEPGRLDAIKMAENLPQNCLREMLKIWLNRVSPPPSWSAIAEAIDLLGDQNLADHLRTKYHISK